MLRDDKSHQGVDAFLSNLPDVVKNTALFYRVADSDLARILTTTIYAICEYPKGGLIASEGEYCQSLGIVLEGAIELQRIFTSGKTLSMARLSPGNVFGEATVFSSTHTYPATVAALENTKIMYIQRREIISLCSRYPEVLQAFLELLSNRILLLNKKIRALSLGTIRQKIASFLLDEYKRQHSTTLLLPVSRQSLAGHMGIQRPSLSRELIKMQDKGLIRFSGNTVVILDLPAIEELAY